MYYIFLAINALYFSASFHCGNMMKEISPIAAILHLATVTVARDAYRPGNTLSALKHAFRLK